MGDDDVGFIEDKKKRATQYGKDVYGNTSELFKKWNHTTMFVVTSWLSAIIMIVAITSDKTVVAMDACDDDELSQTFRCNPRDVPRALAHINVRQEHTYYYAGLWTAVYGGGETGAVCDDWPTSSPHELSTVYDGHIQFNKNMTNGGSKSEWAVCDDVKLVRILYTAAIVLLIIGAIPGTIYLVKSKMETGYEPFWKFDITAYCLMIAAILTCAGYWIYQENIHEELEAQLKLSVHVHVESVGRYYSTLGYSYALPLWSWIWTPVVILTKVIFNHLDVPHHDKDKRERNEPIMRPSTSTSAI